MKPQEGPKHQDEHVDKFSKYLFIMIAAGIGLFCGAAILYAL